MAGLNTAAIAQYNRQLQQVYGNTNAITNQQGQTKSLLQTSLSQNISQQSNNASNLVDLSKPQEQTAEESVKVSSSLGKAAAKGQLTKAEAMAIYEKIASFL